MHTKHHRLDRFISQKKQIKKKDIRLILAQKRVIVNGKTAMDTQQIIGPFCHISLDGEVLQRQQAFYLMLYKPVGYISATHDDKQQTIFDLINQTDYPNLHMVGRLDLNTSGLILLTNDSKWSRAICSPKTGIKKHYLVGLENKLTTDYIDAFANGMFFNYENKTTQPALLEIIDDRLAQVSLSEGMYHQVKRMFGRFRNPVLSLHRYRIGPINLCPKLIPGQYRELTIKEQQDLQHYIDDTC
jgi:16S rRNA pseudouridine516 synthase